MDAATWFSFSRSNPVTNYTACSLSPEHLPLIVN